MDDILGHILSQSSNPQDVEHLVRMLYNNKDILMRTAENLMNETTELLQIISVISAEQIPVMAVLLEVQSESLQESCYQTFFDRAYSMLNILGTLTTNYAMQLRRGDINKAVLTSINIVFRKLVNVAHSLGRACTIVLPLLRFTDVFCPATNALTTCHSVLMEAFVSAGMHDRGYKYSKSYTVYGIDSVFCTAPTFDAVTFFYYAGMCSLAMKQYEEALVYFMDAITLPSPSGLSAVAIAAIKKARIVSMLVRHPVALDIPKYAPNAVTRHFKQGDAVYDTTLNLFMADDIKGLKVHLAAEATLKLLKKDGNFGLAKLTIKALLRNRLLSLVPVFSRMSLEDVRKFKFSDLDWSTSDVEAFIVELCASEELSAKINQLDGTLTFYCSDYMDSEKQAGNSSAGAVMLELQDRLETSLNLNSRIRVVQNEIHKHPNVVARKLAGMKNSYGPDDVSQNPMLANDIMEMLIEQDDSEDP